MSAATSPKVRKRGGKHGQPCGGNLVVTGMALRALTADLCAGLAAGNSMHVAKLCRGHASVRQWQGEKVGQPFGGNLAVAGPLHILVPALMPSPRSCCRWTSVAVGSRIGVKALQNEKDVDIRYFCAAS
mmetsp:Transcript_101460/g.327021  ORF Transcript_101460/g.327021 Transcript_101460/m.327021 type:complete len:129 (-) Transcript_101460:201-587(-)